MLRKEAPMNPLLLPVLAAVLAAAPAAVAAWDYGTRNTDLAPAFEGQTRAPRIESASVPVRAVIATGLAHPWAVVALPDGGYLVTERAGTLRHVSAEGTVSAPVAGVPEVLAERQGGLLDVALGPDFGASRRLWLTYSKPLGGGLSATAAATAILSDDLSALSDVRDIFVQAPPSPTPMHYGSRIVPEDGVVWITTGEHASDGERVLAQNPDTTFGKVVRLLPDGGVPADNPFADRGGAAAQVWSLGHRNLQGAALAPDGTLWTLEHGPKGGDELNRIGRGANYGWPVVSYGENYDGSPVGSGGAHGEGFTEPVYFWDPVIAPGGFVFYDGAMFPDWQGDILAASLSPGGIVRLVLKDGRVAGEERFFYGEARVRDIAVAPDGAVIAVTDAEDGALWRLTPGG
ncbi:MAG: PQQ-dependent sugar dehydrogenase [Rhodobacteraceae bacterium]|nr:PQQ-dependent sugar dehydrogenase [Paracoccaceae bacterium]